MPPLTCGLSRSLSGKEQGLSLIELIVAIVLLAILGVGFLSMYGNVTRRNASADQVAPMTWFAQGVMEDELRQTELGLAPFSATQTAGPYKVVARVVSKTRKSVSTGSYYSYFVTVTVTCVTRSCQPLILASYVYTT